MAVQVISSVPGSTGQRVRQCASASRSAATSSITPAFSSK